MFYELPTAPNTWRVSAQTPQLHAITRQCSSLCQASRSIRDVAKTPYYTPGIPKLHHCRLSYNPSCCSVAPCRTVKGYVVCTQPHHHHVTQSSHSINSSDVYPACDCMRAQCAPAAAAHIPTSTSQDRQCQRHKIVQMQIATAAQACSTGSTSWTPVAAIFSTADTPAACDASSTTRLLRQNLQQ
jgi:hypothetical protein